MARLVEVSEEKAPKLVEVSKAPANPAESNASYAAGRNAPGAARGLLSVMQGPTFGFMDELAGVAGAGKALVTGGSPGQGYRDWRDYARGAADFEQEQNPIFTGLTRLAASAPTMLLTPTAAPAATMTGNAVNAAKTGFVTGTVSGVGASDAETAGGVAMDALKSGGLSAAMGAASVPVTRGMGSVYENVASRVNETAAMRSAREKVAEALARDARGTLAQQNPQAMTGQVSARLSQLGPEGRLADAGGDNTRALLDTLTILPGQTKPAVSTAIRDRQAGRADRMIGAAERSLGTGGERAASVVDDLIQTRSTAATPLYGRLHRMGVQADAELADLLNRADELGATGLAQRIATARPGSPPYSLSASQWNANSGNLSMRDLDHVKQGLDQLVLKQTRPDGTVTPEGLALQELRASLLRKLDGATNGFYKQARDAFAGPSALIDATNAGRRFMTQDDAATRGALAGLSASEQEAFRLGAFEALRNKLGRPGGQTEVLGMWKDKILREKLQAVFPNERAFREFAASAAGESRMKALEAVGRGSQTAQRQFAAGDLDVPAVTDMMQVMSGAGGMPGVLSTLSRQWNRVQTPEPVRDAMGRLLLSQGPQARNALMEVDSAARAVAAQRARNANALGVGSGQATNALLLPLLAPR